MRLGTQRKLEHNPPRSELDQLDVLERWKEPPAYRANELGSQAEYARVPKQEFQ